MTINPTPQRRADDPVHELSRRVDEHSRLLLQHFQEHDEREQRHWIRSLTFKDWVGIAVVVFTILSGIVAVLVKVDRTAEQVAELATQQEVNSVRDQSLENKANIEMLTRQLNQIGVDVSFMRGVMEGDR